MKKDFLSQLRKPHLLKRMGEKILSYFFFEQWILLISKETKNEPPSWNNFTPLMPPSDRIWADPFIWIHAGNYFIFYEEQLYSTRRGRIGCLTLDKQMNPTNNCIVLERPYHLSYPFIFEYQEQIYMIPETEQNRAVELYRCTHFPDQWEFVKTLIADIKAVDTTLLEAYGRWWLFTNIREGKYSWDTLYLFSADHPLSDQWTPHPCNPIVKDIRSARPAGRVFLHNGKIIRPSQDCSVRYGYAINFNRISVLTESNYAEIRETVLKPPVGRNILATHTWNQSGDLIAIDALIRKLKV
ncbi:MAG: hypothetical protein EHM33_09395 [Chloroflexi bacterium]|nr:MAG: hypothetical protein EHM33_09395 [Chloroflexota bacterium]